MAIGLSFFYQQSIYAVNIICMHKLPSHDNSIHSLMFPIVYHLKSNFTIVACEKAVGRDQMKNEPRVVIWEIRLVFLPLMHQCLCDWGCEWVICESAEWDKWVLANIVLKWIAWLYACGANWIPLLVWKMLRLIYTWIAFDSTSMYMYLNEVRNERKKWNNCISCQVNALKRTK